MTQPEFERVIREDARRWMTNAEVVADIESVFKEAARAYARKSYHLRNWVTNGNTLPSVYV